MIFRYLQQLLKSFNKISRVFILMFNFNTKIKIFTFLFLISNIFNCQNFSLIQKNSIKVIVNNDTLLNPWTGGLNSVQISKIDLNNDQVEDLFVFDRSCNKSLTFVSLNNNFIYAPEFENLFPSDLKNWVLLRDFNKDGKKDIFSYVAGGIGVWENTTNSNGLTFSPLSFFQSSINGNVPYILSNQYNNDVNIYVVSSDIPSISDIDDDGDLDILNFGVQGASIEYHRNLSVELGLNLDTLIFEMRNTCWGHFTESGLSNTCSLFDTCSFNIANPQDSITITRNNSRHSGSTILSLDLNDDQVKDIILGDVSFSNIVALYNDNKGINLNTSFIAQDTNFPSYSVPADVHLFPGVFYEDVDHDTVKDLLLSPNSTSDAIDKESIWFYKNFGTNSFPQFYLQKKNFLQENTIDLGRESKPIIIDINNDQIQDLIIANFGEFDLSTPLYYKSYIELYLNIGTNSNPVFGKVSNDFQNISSLINDINLVPSFGDLDSDGDIDVIVGDYSGKLHYLENSSSNPGIFNLTIGSSPMSDILNNIFDFGFNSHPTLFDIDNDNDLDIIIGESSGNLNYVENIGDSLIFNFNLRSENLGGVEVSQWWTNLGFSAPVLHHNGSNLELYVGSKSGAIFKYNNIENNLAGAFNLVDSNFFNINTGTYSTPAIYDLNNDSLMDVIIGNKRGGLSLFMGSDEPLISNILNLSKDVFSIFPVPSKDIINIKNISKVLEFEVFNVTGKRIKSGKTNGTISITSLENGIYFLKIDENNQYQVIKFVKC